MIINRTYIAEFFSFYKPYKKLFVADILAAMTVSAVSLSLPLCIRYITGRIVSHTEPSLVREIFSMGALMLGLIVIQCICALFYDYMGHVMGARMERDMRNRLFTRCTELPFSFFDREKTGSLMSRITNDLFTLAELYHHGPEDIIIYFLGFAGALVILLRINAKLALTICAFLPVMIIYSFFFNRKLKKAYAQSRERIDAVNVRTEDSLAGIRVVKSYTNEKLETDKFKKANEMFYRSKADIYRHEAWFFTGLTRFFSPLVMVAAVVFGGIWLSGAKLDMSDLVSFILYVNYLTAPIPEFARITQMYQEGLAGFSRFMEIMNMAGEAPDDRGIILDKVKGKVEFKNVSFRYHDDYGYVLKNFSLEVQAGEYVALTGPSGIGKTTLCSLIPRFYETSEGAVLIDGTDIRDINLRSLRRNIGVVQQDVYLFAGTIRDNIAYGKPDAAFPAVEEAARRAHAHDFIMNLPRGYDTEIGQRGATLSGGQRQRLCIARLFLKDPPILIFDEATSALDMESEMVIQESLKELAKNRTTFVIAHRESTIKNAGRIVTLTGDGSVSVPYLPPSL
jgi:ATP-binding cassette subfamily B protein